MSKVAIFLYKVPRTPKAAPADWLDADELTRYERMTSGDRREEFLHGRALIKAVAREHYGIPSPRIRVAKNGRPYLRGLSFSLSHSHGYIALAVAGGSRAAGSGRRGVGGRTQLGVDIERGSGKKNFREVAKRYFLAHENEQIESSRSPEKIFLHLWALKEAYVKACNGVLNRSILKTGFDLKTSTFTARRDATFLLNRELNLAVCAFAPLRSVQVFKVTNLARPKFRTSSMKWSIFKKLS